MSDGRAREVLTLVAERLSQFGPVWSAENIDGSLLRGPGSLGVILRENHTDHEAHLDLDLVLNVDRPAETNLSDCTTGAGPDVASQWRRCGGRRDRRDPGQRLRARAGLVGVAWAAPAPP